MRFFHAFGRGGKPPLNKAAASRRTPYFFCAYALLLFCGTPFLLWWAKRMAGGTDDAIAGLAGITGAVAVLLAAPQTAPAQRTPGWFAPALLLVLYAVAMACGLPPTFCGMVWLAAFLFAPGPWRRGVLPDLPVAGLLFTGVPAMMTLEFLAGYPLRLAASTLAAWIIHCAGLPVVRDGVLLTVADQPVWVDAPCSGIRMLWSGMWLTFLLAGIFHLTPRRTVFMAGAGLLVILLANALRVAGLAVATFFTASETLHTVVGIGAFVNGAVLLLFLAYALRGKGAPPATGGRPTPPPTRLFFLAATMAAVFVAVLFFATKRGAATPPLPADFEWPAQFEGRPLISQPLTRQEQIFAQNVPGAIGKFSAGGDTLILRYITRPTRFVHSAADCLGASGWTIQAQPLLADDTGMWGVFRAERNGAALRVRERCTDLATGQTWPDISAWFWSAHFGKSRGPWLVTTVATGLVLE